jgi:Ca-activated chloride channel homolog
MRIESPQYLIYIFFVPFILLFLILLARNNWRLTGKIISLSKIRELVPDFSRKKDLLKAMIYCFSITMLLIAMARPQYGQKEEEAFMQGINIMVVFDVSNSMLCEDLKPSRLLKAKHEVETVIDLLGSDRVGLVAFSGAAVLVSPLTTDHSSFKMYLDSLDTSFLASNGTAVSRGIKMAIDSLKKDHDQSTSDAILLVTDGEDHEGGLDQVLDEAKENNIRIYTLAMGSENGAPVPAQDVTGNKIGFKKDNKNEIVMSRVNTKLLSEISSHTNGQMFIATQYESEVKTMVDEIEGLQQSRFKEKKITRYEERYRWALIPAFLLIVLETIL